MKNKETLEEAADRYFPFAEKIGGETYTAYRGFIEVAKWQEQNSDKKYSEEEVREIAKDAYIMGKKNILIGVFNKWFEQFKKK